MPIYVLYTTTRLPLFWIFWTTHKIELGRFFTYEDAASYAHNVCGFETSEHFTIERYLP